MDVFPGDDNNTAAEFQNQIASLPENVLDGDSLAEIYPSNMFGTQDDLRTCEITEELLAQLTGEVKSNEDVRKVNMQPVQQPCVEQATKTAFKDSRARGRSRSTSRIRTPAVSRQTSGRGINSRTAMLQNPSASAGSSSSRTSMDIRDEMKPGRPKESIPHATSIGYNQGQFEEPGRPHEESQIGSYGPRGLQAQGSSTGFQQQAFSSGSRETYARQQMMGNQRAQAQKLNPQQNNEKISEAYPNMVHQKGEIFRVTTVCTECRFKKEYLFKTPGLWPPNKCSQCHSKCNIADWKTSETELSEEIIYLGEFSNKEYLAQRKNEPKVLGPDAVKVEPVERSFNGPQCMQCGGYHNNKALGFPPGFCPQYSGCGHQGFPPPYHPPCGNTHPPCGNTQPPYGNTQPPYGNTQPPFGNTQLPFGNTQLPFGNTQPPFGNTQLPYGNTQLPFSNTQPPYGNPYQPFRNQPYHQHHHWGKNPYN